MLVRKGYPSGMAVAVVREALAEEGQEVDDPPFDAPFDGD